MRPKNIFTLTTKIKNEKSSFAMGKMSKMKKYRVMLAFCYTNIITAANKCKILTLENKYFQSKGQVLSEHEL